MHRGFETSTRRRQRSLDGPWEFVTDPADVGEDAEFVASFPSDEADQIPVPCSWTAHEEYADYVGPAWYRRTFTVEEDTGAIVRFTGVGGAFSAFLDGEHLARADDGAVPVEGLRYELAAGEHELVVRVDNRPDQRALGDAEGPPTGGIHGAVVLEELPDVYVANATVESELEGEDALLEAEITVHNLGHHIDQRRITLDVAGEYVSGTLPVGGRDASTVTLPLLIEDVDRWTPADPTLYDATVRLDPIPDADDPDVTGTFTIDATSVAATAVEDADVAVTDAVPGGAVDATDAGPVDDTDESSPAGDELVERVGFREVAVEGLAVLVDGEPVTLAAVNRQRHHPEWGAAVPAEIQQADVEALQAADINAVRCPDVVHPRFLDRCDEAGILVVEGFGVRGIEAEAFAAGGAGSDARGRVSALVKRDRHHPSVIAWTLVDGVAATDEAARDAVGQLAEVVRGHDDDRLLTVATPADWGEERDRTVELCDVISVADDRAGAGPDDEWGGHDADEWAATLDRTATRYGEKPILVSSFAGLPRAADDGDETTDASPAAQADRIADLVEAFQADAAVAGFAVWQFADTPGDHSGIVTADREPKPAYDRLADLFEDGTGGD